MITRYTQETKGQSVSSIARGSSAPKNVKIVSLAGKVMASILFEMSGNNLR